MNKVGSPAVKIKIQQKIILIIAVFLLPGCVYWRSGVLLDEMEFVALEDDISNAVFYQEYQKEMCQENDESLKTEYISNSVDHAVYAEFIKHAKEERVRYISNLTSTNKTRWVWLVFGTLTWDCAILTGDLYR